MGRRSLRLREVVGLIKDKASQSKALFSSNPNTLFLHLAVIRGTTHSPHAPPQEQHVVELLSLGDASRATASALVKSLMDRLLHTSNAAVALKCLIMIHHIIKRGPFILQDQLSIFPATGGRNYLNLSAFHDRSTPSAWTFSIWVRFYARYLETLLSTSRTLGFFLGSYSSTAEKDRQEERLSSFLNRDLIREIDSLVGLMEDICKIPADNLDVEGIELVLGITGLIGSDYLSAVNESVLRITEFKERLGSLSFGQSVELTCCLKRLEDCRERMERVMIPVRKLSMETLWVLTEELKEKVVGFGFEDDDDGKGKITDHRKTTRLGTESARFLNNADNSSVKFSSTRFVRLSQDFF